MASLAHKNPVLSIIAVNYNGTADTLEMLQSIKAAHFEAIEVIVVDNASKENPAEAIHASFPEVQVIRSDENLGFAGGNNLGIAVAKGQYIMLLNNDTVVHPNFAEPIVHAFQSHEDVGVVASKIEFLHSPGVLQYAGSTQLNPYTLTSFAIGWGQQDRGQYASGYTHLAHGAAMTVSRKAIEKAGTMEDGYFLYYEELDWCLQLQKAGFKIWFENDSLIYHKESMSVGKQSPLKEYYKTRNRILLARRNFVGLTRFISIAYLVLVANPLHLIKKLVKGKFTLAKAQWRGLLWHISPANFQFKN
ncbi:glycosyltransferase [bacterium]|nr:glycosyltransferase [bacterium]